MSAHLTQDGQVTRDSPGRFVPCHPPANYEKTQSGPFHVSSPDPRCSGCTGLAWQVRPVSSARQLQKDPRWSPPCQLTWPKMVRLHGTRLVGLSRVILPPTTKRPNLVPSMSAHPTQDVQVARDSPGRFVPCHPLSHFSHCWSTLKILDHMVISLVE